MFGRSGGGESRSTRTFTETTGSGANAVTKTVVEETIIRADGSKTTNRKETITHGSSNASSGAIKSSQFPSSDDSKKKEKGGVLGVCVLFINSYELKLTIKWKANKIPHWLSETVPKSNIKIVERSKNQCPPDT